jgi:hypothetical protein
VVALLEPQAPKVTVAVFKDGKLAERPEDQADANATSPTATNKELAAAA